MWAERGRWFDLENDAKKRSVYRSLLLVCKQCTCIFVTDFLCANPAGLHPRGWSRPHNLKKIGKLSFPTGNDGEVIGPRRIFLVRDSHVPYKFFQDWLDPFLNALTLVANVEFVDHSCAENTFCTRFKTTDIVLLLHSSYSVQINTGATYWLLNTEGRDKTFAEIALSRGIELFIDYCQYNVEYLLKKDI